MTDLTVTDVRSQVRDLPRNIGLPPESPRVLGSGDGNNTTFYLPTGKKMQYYSTVVPATLFLGGTSTPASNYTITPPTVVVFNAAPPAGVLVTAQFQVTLWTDTELQNYLNRNVLKYGGINDQTVLKGCTYDLIDVLLMDTELLAALQEDTWKQDPSAVINAMTKLKAMLYKDLEGGPQPGELIPYLSTSTICLPPYQPRR